MADEGVERPGQVRLPGWYPAGATPNEQMHWDGQHWTSAGAGSTRPGSTCRWTPARAPGGSRRPRAPPGHRWSTTTVVLLVLALAGLGGVIFAVVSGVDSADHPVDVSDHRCHVQACVHVDPDVRLESSKDRLRR